MQTKVDLSLIEKNALETMPVDEYRLKLENDPSENSNWSTLIGALISEGFEISPSVFSSVEDFSSFFDFFWAEGFCLLEKIELKDFIPFFFDLVFFDGEGCLFSSPAAESIEFGS